MRHLLLIGLFTLFVVPVVRSEDKALLVREIPVKLAAIDERGDAMKPTKITTEVELKKVFGATADEVAKSVDFKKEYLLLFQWSGSGGDKLTAGDDKKAVTLNLKRGLTRDLRPHSHLFAVAKDAEWKFAK